MQVRFLHTITLRSCQDAPRGKLYSQTTWEQINPGIPRPAAHPCWQCWVRLILEHTGHMAQDRGTAWGLYGDTQPGLRDHLLRLH